MENNDYSTIKPSVEQKQFIELAKEGNNILVDACIGSGKTTAIQKLCQSLPSTEKILYLTYNKLLKLDAQSKILNRNATVQNYHGFAYMALAKAGIRSGISDLIQTFNRSEPHIPVYDVLILDEYQDIDVEISQMLDYIKSTNPNMQIIAVGDMAQKIYDKTTLKVLDYIDTLLDDYIQLEFTQCFRLSEDLAATLGRIWGKTINGVNPNCVVETMTRHEVVPYLATHDPSEIMCLGARTGVMANTLNTLEKYYPDKFNKNTVYASISDQNKGSVSPTSKNAIFTTFDSSKGMERNICVVFDYDQAYWHSRLIKPQQKYEILRNIFLVAASRGKERIIFVNGDRDILDEKTLSTVPKSESSIGDTTMQSLFAFKYKEDVENAYDMLTIDEVKPKDDNYTELKIKSHDGLIDLSPCINIYQLVANFDNYDIDSELDLLYQQKYKHPLPDYQKALSLENKILLLTSLITGQMRYRHQVKTPFITESEKVVLHERIRSILPSNTVAQIPSTLKFTKRNRPLFEAQGYAHAIKDDIVYHLVYTDEITHEQYLEAACYMLGTNHDRCIIWNTKTNTLAKITVNDDTKFINQVLKTASKGVYTRNT